MSVDELLKAIKGANGMPVLFVPSSDGRLAAVAVDGLHQNLVPANSFSKKRNQQDFRAWLLLLTSLVATVTFTAGLAPPGGFWDADDRANRHIAGTSIMRDKFPRRYLVFYYSNTTAFFASLMIIGMLAKNVYNKETVVLKNRIFVALVGLCFVSLGTSYITGTWVSPKGGVYNIVMFVLVICYMTMHWVLDFIVWMQRRAT